ncbi:glycosyltransferase 87 family protein [Ekhidna sp. MALMAid0563]|uniref:glycosyltransferase 87 family protein n=1 Tax=Ekhidna sp. MALMAid0563 TaxID=3143937 RepID=UPI0032DF92BD
MPKYNQTGYYTFLVVYILAIFSIGNWIERYQSLPLMLAYASAFMGYIFLLQKSEDTKTLFITGLIIRALLFFTLPSLSDDLYRFIWDGTLIKNDIHPFAELPGYYLEKNIDGISSELYGLLNSPNYFTIYPPINQAIFWLSAGIGIGDWLVSANVIRLVLCAADVGSYFLLKSILRASGKPVFLANWFWLNPLIILEGVGNLHFEGLVVFFILLGIYGYQKSKYVLAAGGFGLAIGTKLLPLIYLPVLFLSGLKNKKWWVAPVAGVIALLTIVPMLDATFLSGMQESLELYFQSFEFNASIYFAARQIGYWIYGYNNIALIGPLLSLLSFLSICVVSIVAWKKEWSLSKSFLFVLTIYLLFATTVHPWYIIPLIVFGVLSGYWYPIVWSFLIFLTYLGYDKNGFELPMYLVVIEYVVVLSTMIIECGNTPIVPSRGHSTNSNEGKSPFEGG